VITVVFTMTLLAGYNFNHPKYVEIPDQSRLRSLHLTPTKTHVQLSITTFTRNVSVPNFYRPFQNKPYSAITETVFQRSLFTTGHAYLLSNTPV